MRVKCLKAELQEFDSKLGSYVWVPNLIIGKTYFVVSIESNQYRLMTDPRTTDEIGGPYLYPQEMFEIIDSATDLTWVKEHDSETGQLSYFGPAKFRGFFWEEFHDLSIEQQKTIIKENRHLLY